MVKTIFEQSELKYIKENAAMMTYSEIADELNKFNTIKKTERQVRAKGRALGVDKKKQHFNNRYFKEINTREKAYWLGFIFADGYVVFNPKRRNYEVSIELNSIDREHLEKFNRAIGGDIEIATRISKDRLIDGVFVKGGVPNSVIRIYSRPMAEDLIALNVVPNKTYKTEYPKVNDEFFLDFLRGFVDGDGHIDSKGIAITNPNYECLNWIRESLVNYAVWGNIYCEKKWKCRYATNVSSTPILTKLLYKNSPVYLERKFNQAIQINNTVA
jgi:hypothetical protein